MSVKYAFNCRVRNRQRPHTSLLVLLLAFSFVLELAGCGGGGNQSAISDRPAGVASATPAATVPSETGDALQGRYVGTVKISDVQYYGDALLTPDGLIRLYVGGPYLDDGTVQQSIPAGSAQLVGALRGQTSRVSGEGLIFGQECAASNPIRFCAEIGHADISVAVESGDIHGEISVMTSDRTETWSLELSPWSNYHVLPATQAALAGQYKEELAEFALSGDTITSIQADGSLFFHSASSGCTGKGLLRPHLDGAVNVYDVSVTISDCHAPYGSFNSIFEGLATTSPSAAWDYDVLLRMWLSRQAAVTAKHGIRRQNEETAAVPSLTACRHCQPYWMVPEGHSDSQTGGLV
jgi:hypothetical protein